MGTFNWRSDNVHVTVRSQSSSNPKTLDRQVCLHNFATCKPRKSSHRLGTIFPQYFTENTLNDRDLKGSRLALLLNWPFVTGLSLMVSYSGLALYAVYKDCDPVASGEITSNDQIMSYFVATRMSKVPGFVGFFVAGIFSASLSTVSALLNSLAAVALEDYIKPLFSK